MNQNENYIFKDLFVLELANNHWGNIDRGFKIIQEFGALVRYHGIKAAIKLQFRNQEDFIHKDFQGRTDIRYVWKTEQTWLEKEHIKAMVEKIKEVGCIPMATPFDNKSVDLCVELGMPLFKIASSDINDWPLIEHIANYRLPTIVSTGGASENDIDNIAKFFTNRDIPLAINHCVSLYPSLDEDIELNQIDYLVNRYPNNVIGFSSHEQFSWAPSMYISYAKGARTWERHIDIEDGNFEVSPYCTTPERANEWFEAYLKAKEMCGGSGTSRRIISKAEEEYLDKLLRGIYAKKSIQSGLVVSHENFDEFFYLAIPLQKGQLSCREVLNGTRILNTVEIDQPIKIKDIDGPLNNNIEIRKKIEARGI